MQIIEQQVMSKDGNMDHCEDGLFISDNFVVVIDGVTAKGKKLWNGKKSGRYARDLILEKLKSVSEDVSAVSFFNFLSGALNEVHGFFTRTAALWRRSCVRQLLYIVDIIKKYGRMVIVRV